MANAIQLVKEYAEENRGIASTLETAIAVGLAAW